MTRETRIGLVVGLGLIIMFGLVVSGLNEPPRTPAEPVRVASNAPAPWFQVRPVEPTPEVRSEQLAAHPADSGGTAEASWRRPHPSDGVVEVSFADRPIPMPVPMETAQRQPEAPAPAPAVAAAAQVAAYTVQPNDSLYRIAEKFYGDGNKYRRLLEANQDKISNADVLAVGLVLSIPGAVAAERAPAAAQTPSAPPVEPARPAQGQERYRTIELRELPQYFAKQTPGAQTSPVPAAKAPSAPGPQGQVAKAPPLQGQAAAAKVYVVCPGDSLTRIARKFLKNDSREAVQKIYAANKDRLRDPNVVPVGTKLVIPS